MIVLAFIFLVLKLKYHFSFGILNETDNLHQISLKRFFYHGEICKINKVLFSCNNKLNVMYFIPKVPIFNKLEGPNNRVIQSIETLSALGHNLKIYYFLPLSKSEQQQQQQQQDVLSNFITTSSINLSELHVPKLRNKRVLSEFKESFENEIAKYEPDLFIFYYYYPVYYQGNFVLKTIKSFYPRGKVMTFMEQVDLSPLEWINHHLKLDKLNRYESAQINTKKKLLLEADVSNSNLTSLMRKLSNLDADDVELAKMESQININHDLLKKIEEKELAELELDSSKEDKHLLEIAPYEKQISFIKNIEKTYIDSSDTVIFDSEEKKNRILCDSEKNPNKYNVLRLMITPLSILSQSKILPKGYSGRKDIVFVGSGNAEVNVKAIKWLDENIIRDLDNGIPGIKCDIYGKHWEHLKDKLLNKDKFNFKNFSSLSVLAEYFNNYISFVYPIISNRFGRNPYILLALESGLPPVMTQSAAEGLCDICNSLPLSNLYDPFDNSSIVKIGTYKSRDYPFLVGSMNDNYNFVEKVKLLNYEPDIWSKYSNMSIKLSQSMKFSRYQAALDIDELIVKIFT